MKIIDSHTHLGCDANLVQVAEELKKVGIGRMIFSNLGSFAPYPDAESVRKFNDAAWHLVQQLPDQLSFLTYINPQLSNWREEITRHISHAVGVKLWVALRHPQTGDLSATAEVLKFCGDHKLPVLLHVFNRSYHNLPGEIDIAELTQLAYQVPHCTMIAAHTGACMHDSCGLFRNMPHNVYWDLSGSFPANNLLQQVLNELPSNRILYGSDALGRSFASQLLKVTALQDLTAEQKENILWRNAARIYQLPPPPELTVKTTLPDWNFTTDYHCYCGHDPFGVAQNYTPEKLDEFMRSHGVKTAYCTNFNSLLHWDPTPENCRFAETCAPLKVVKPLWSVNVQAHNFELTACHADNYAVGGIWTSCYWSAVSPDDARLIQLGEICDRLELPLFVHLGGPAEDRFRFPGVAPRTATAEEIARLLEAVPHCRIYLQGEGDGCKLSSGNHFQVSYFPDDRRSSPRDEMQQVWGSGFPVRSFPIFV